MIDFGWLGLPLIDHVHRAQWRALLRALPPQSVDILFADMPYNVTACDWDSYIVPLDAFWRHVRRVMKPRGAVVLTGSQPFTSKLVMSNPDWFRYALVYEKTRATTFALSDYMPLRSHEDVCIFGLQTPHYYPQMSKGKAYTLSNFAGGRIDGVKKSTNGQAKKMGGLERYPTSIIRISNSSSECNQHPTQKPVALLEYLIRTYTNAGDLVVDPFCGSGTTAVAAANTGRHYIVGDISPEYVEIARRRLSLEFGRPAPRRAREVEPLDDLPLFAEMPGD